MSVITLEEVCEFAFQGDTEGLAEVLGNDTVKSGNVDINMHHTNMNALHMAAIAGQQACVKLLLQAKADPHVRAVTLDGKDPKEGKLASDYAAKFGHASLATLLQQEEKAHPLGNYVPRGIGNNRKLYRDEDIEPEDEPTAAEAPVAADEPVVPTGPPVPAALLFPGQGSQYVKMLDGVKNNPEVKDLLARAKEVLGYDLLELCLNGPEEKLAETRYCQPALFVGGLAGMAKLREQRAEAVDRPQCVAGLSLGEYTALCAAGVLTFEDGLRLVKLRGEAMQVAAEASAQAMISIAGLDGKVLEALCKEAASKAGNGEVCQVANSLFPKGYACAGTQKAVDCLKGLAEKKGALQAKLLKTSGGFHTSLMQPAATELQAAIDEVLPRMRPPRCTVYPNVTAEPIAPGTDPSEFVGLLGQQLVSPVLWCDSMKKMISDGVQDFYECGPQKQLKAMMKRIDNKVANKTVSMEV